MMKREYFPGLDTLRLYAAVSVIMTHGNVLAASGERTLSGLFLDGGQAVSLFFVLSGFLITYILLKEKDATGTIDVRRFYVRRSLRIWPLYYLLVLLAYVVLPLVLPTFSSPAPSTLPHALTFTVFIPHAVDQTTMGWFGHLWSISVEEGFYLLWPLLLKRLPVIPVCLAIIAVRAAMTSLVVYQSESVAMLNYFLRVESMAVGSLAAVIFLRYPLSIRVLTHPAIGWTMFGLGVLISLRVVGATTLIESVVYALVILNLAAGRALKWMSWSPLARYGKYTYGIYLWHYPVIGLLVAMGLSLGYFPSLALVLVATFGLSLLSYRFVEAPFLRRKSVAARQEATISILTPSTH